MSPKISEFYGAFNYMPDPNWKQNDPPNGHATGVGVQNCTETSPTFTCLGCPWVTVLDGWSIRSRWQVVMVVLAAVPNALPPQAGV